MEGGGRPFSQSITRERKRKNNNYGRQSLPPQKWGKKKCTHFSCIIESFLALEKKQIWRNCVVGAGGRARE